MSKTEFEYKIEKLNNNDKKKELLELYKTNPDKAYTEYRIELALKIAKENKTLFERLSKL